MLDSVSRLSQVHQEMERRTSKREPETTIRGESGSGKSVSADEFLNTGNQLSETTVGECHSHYDVGCGDSSSLDIVHGQDEGGGSETHQSEGRRVTESTISTIPTL